MISRGEILIIPEENNLVAWSSTRVWEADHTERKERILWPVPNTNTVGDLPPQEETETVLHRISGGHEAGFSCRGKEGQEP